jgi:hypothetical protein
MRGVPHYRGDQREHRLGAGFLITPQTSHSGKLNEREKLAEESMGCTGLFREEFWKDVFPIPVGTGGFG